MAKKNVAKLTIGGNEVEVAVKAEKKAKVAKKVVEKKTTEKPAKKTAKKAEKPEPVAAPQAEKPVAPPTPAEPPKPLSLKDRLLAKAGSEKSFDVTKLAAGLREKQEVCREPALMAEFAEMISAADELAIDKLSFDQSTADARDEWFGLSLTEMIARLKGWANQDAEIAKLVASLNDYLQNNFVGETFWRVIQMIARPFAMVNNRGELTKALDRLVQDGLVEKNSGRYDKDAVVVFLGVETKLVYAPKRERNVTTNQWEPKQVLLLGWQFVQAAGARAREEANQRYKELKALRDKASLNPKEAIGQSKGTFYVPGGKTRGLLLENDGSGKIRIVEAVDFRVGQLPSRWISWDVSPDSWPSRDASFVFGQWRQRAEQARDSGE